MRRYILHARPTFSRSAFLPLLLASVLAFPARAQTVEGRAVDRETQQPILNAAVVLVDSAGDAVATGRTAADGRFRLTAPRPGEYRLTASRLGYRTMLSAAVSLAARQVVEVLLGAAPAAAQAVVTGTVEGTYGARVSQASVSVYNAEGVEVAYRVTDVSGRFTVHLPVGGTYRVHAIAEDFQPASRTVRVRDDGTASTRVQLRERDRPYRG